MTQDTKWSNLSQAQAVENFTARLGTLTFPRIAPRRAVQRRLRMAFDFVPTNPSTRFARSGCRDCAQADNWLRSGWPRRCRGCLLELDGGEAYREQEIYNDYRPPDGVHNP